MATRIESGRIQIDAPGGVPMERIAPQQVDFMVAAREEARGAATMADILDRMSTSVFGMAKEMAQEEAIKFAAENPITDQQLALAREGLPSAIPGVGKTSGDFSVYGKALQKARTLQLSGYFEMEGRNELTKLLVDVQNGKASSTDVANKIAVVTDGYAKSLAKIDGEASIKLRATMATHGNTVLNAAYESELKRKKSEDITKFDLDFDNTMKLLEATVSRGFWIDQNGQQRSINDLAKNIEVNISNQSMLIGDAGVQKEYSEKFRVALRTAKINAVTKHVMSDEFMADPTATLNKIRTGDVGKMSQVLKEMVATDFDAVAKVTANYMLAVNQKEEIARRDRDNKKRIEEGKAINLLEQIFPIEDPKNPTRQKLVAELMQLDPGSLPIGTIKDLLEPKKEGEGNSLAEYNALGMIFDGKITDKAQLDRIPGLNIKQRLTLLKALRSENKAGDRELDSGLNKLSGINADPSTIVVLDKNSAEFKRKQELKARALAIQAEVTAKGETITERQILNQIESEILAKKNTSEAKQALDSLNYYVIDKNGRAKPDRDWVTGPINRQTLPALKQKAEATKDPGDRTRRLRQIQEIERLLKISEGG
jgi:hypothetical protein